MCWLGWSWVRAGLELGLELGLGLEFHICVRTGEPGNEPNLWSVTVVFITGLIPLTPTCSQKQISLHTSVQKTSRKSEQ